MPLGRMLALAWLFPALAGAGPSFKSLVLEIPCFTPQAPDGEQGTACDGLEGFWATRATFHQGENELFAETRLQFFGPNVVQLYLDGRGDAGVFAAMYGGVSSILLQPELRVRVEIQKSLGGPFEPVTDVPYRPGPYALRAFHSDDTAALEQDTLARDDDAIASATAYTEQEIAREAAARRAADARLWTLLESERTRATKAESALAAGLATLGRRLGNEVSIACPAGMAIVSTGPGSWTCALRCGGVKLDCNLEAADGCETNTLKSIVHCGSCGIACRTGPHVTTTCDSGECNVRCTPPFLECDRSFANGCETNRKTDRDNCGKCGVRCREGQVCAAGKCAPCDQGLDCDGDNHCETSIFDDANCGACGHVCQHTRCLSPAARCAEACDPGWASCDGNPANGCETNVAADPEDCGRCGVRCPLGVECVDGVCAEP